MVPPIGEPVRYRKPLTDFEHNMLKEGKLKLSDLVPIFYPLRVFRADRVVHDNDCCVRVQGYIDTPPTHLTGEIESHEGFVRTSMIHVVPVWVEDVRGPSEKPGCWSWRGEPW